VRQVRKGNGEKAKAILDESITNSPGDCLVRLSFSGKLDAFTLQITNKGVVLSTCGVFDQAPGPHVLLTYGGADTLDCLELDFGSKKLALAGDYDFCINDLHG